MEMKSEMHQRSLPGGCLQQAACSQRDSYQAGQARLKALHLSELGARKS